MGHGYEWDSTVPTSIFAQNILKGKFQKRSLATSHLYFIIIPNPVHDIYAWNLWRGWNKSYHGTRELPVQEIS